MMYPRQEGKCTAVLNLINLLVSLRRLPPLSELTGEEERMMFELKVLYDRRGALSVADVYDLMGGKSATTAYRNLIGLKDKGLVSIEIDETDKRRRHVHFTDLANNVFRAIR